MIADLKPYAEYKESGSKWLGRVPGHWEVRKVREVAVVINGFPFDSKRFSLFQGHPLIRIRDLNKAHTAARYSGRFVEAARVMAGDLLIGMDGDFNVGTWLGAEPALLNQRMCCVRARGSWTTKYLRFVLPRALLEINDVTYATTVKHLASSQVERIAFGAPPEEEQAAIVQFLDWADGRLERAIRAKRKVIALLNEQKQAIIHRAVTRGLDPSVPLKPSGVPWLGDIPQHWEVTRAKYLYREVDERSAYGNEELLSVSHLTGVTPRRQKNITMFKAASYAGHKLCRPGDLVVNTMWAWMGALGASTHTGIVSPAYAVYRPHRPDSIVGTYMDGLLRSRPYVSNIICRSTGLRASRLRLYPEEFFRLPIIQPPVEEQNRIVEAIREETASLDTAISRLEREIELLREYRTRLVADVVTGKLDVREAAALLPDEPPADAVEDDSDLDDETDLADEEATL